MAQAQAYNYTTRICNPQPNECQGVITASASLLISDAANPNGRTPRVGDCYISPASGTTCSGTSSLGYNTVWVVESLIQPSSSGVGIRQSAQCCQTWNCKTDKLGNIGCVDPRNGSGIYNSLQDCRDNCESTLISNDSFVNILEDVIEPWVDSESAACLYDIKSCPCGWDYVKNYQPPEVTPPQQPVYTQFTGANMCLSPDYALWESTLGSAAPNSTFGGLVSPFSLSCANLQGAYNPTIGMTIEGSSTNALGNYLAGSITNTINNVTTTYTWDKHVIVEVNPAFNSSILNPNLQVIQSTPC
jgi:hypothetical protein